MPERLTIAIPSFNTEALLRELLRRLRAWAPGAQVLVVDTGSGDGSRALAERSPGAELLPVDDAPIGAAAHGAALDAALAAASRPLLLALDSDAIPSGPRLFRVLVDEIDGGAEGAPAAAVGTTKDPATLGRANRFFRWLRRTTPGPEWGYLRPNRALYDVTTLRRLGLRFVPGRSGRVGEDLARALVAAGERCVLLPPARMERLCVHLRHGTLALNPELFPGARPRDVRKAKRRLARFLRHACSAPLGRPTI
jgi:glycosyltransferase involved in cell wall biosynthesis